MFLLSHLAYVDLKEMLISGYKYGSYNYTTTHMYSNDFYRLIYLLASPRPYPSSEERPRTHALCMCEVSCFILHKRLCDFLVCVQKIKFTKFIYIPNVW